MGRSGSRRKEYYKEQWSGKDPEHLVLYIEDAVLPCLSPAGWDAGAQDQVIGEAGCHRVYNMLPFLFSFNYFNLNIRFQLMDGAPPPQVKAIDEAGCDWVHVDVMDGRFVPNITIGPLVVDALRPITDKPLDCHLVSGGVRYL